MEEIRLALEYMCSSVWLVKADGGLEDIGPGNIQISQLLKSDIEKWDRVYQSTLDQSYPPDSGFSSESANKMLWQAFHEEGRSLFHRLESELSGLYHVTSSKYKSV